LVDGDDYEFLGENFFMKILVFSPRSINCSRAGGAEIYLHEIIIRIKEHEFFVISSSDKRGGYQHLSYSENLISVNEFLFPIFSLKYLKFVKDFDVIIENISKFPIIWPLLLSKLLSKLFIVIVHHIHGRTLFRELPFPFALLLYIYEVFSLKLYSLFGIFVITVSISTKRELIKLGFPKHKILVIYPGYNPKLRIYCNTLKAKEPLIVYIGRVKKYKRLDHLIKAIEIVKQKAPNVKCVIAGKCDKDVYRKLRNLTKRFKLEANVIIKGEVSEEEKLRLLRKATIFVNPSMKEGFSIASLEAQACGIPVVGYEIPGLVDCVKNNVTGLLVPNGNYKALAKAILHLLLDEKLRSEMSKNAMIWASNFDWDLSAKKFLALLIRLIKKIVS